MPRSVFTEFTAKAGSSLIVDLTHLKSESFSIESLRVSQEQHVPDYHSHTHIHSHALTHSPTHTQNRPTHTQHIVLRLWCAAK